MAMSSLRSGTLRPLPDSSGWITFLVRGSALLGVDGGVGVADAVSAGGTEPVGAAGMGVAAGVWPGIVVPSVPCTKSLTALATT